MNWRVAIAAVIFPTNKYVLLTVSVYLVMIQLEDYGLGAQCPLNEQCCPLSERVIKSPAGEEFMIVSQRNTRHITT